MRMFLNRMIQLSLLLCQEATRCQPAEVSFDWMEEGARREANPLVKSLFYRSARSVRKMVKTKASLR